MVVLRRCCLLLAALAACLAALPVAGQGPEVGAFAGTVRDEKGQPLAGATIVFRGVELNIHREIQTDKHGSFYYGGFQPGRYHITVRREQQVLWSFPVTLPPLQEVLRLDLDLKKLGEAAERLSSLDPELERQQQAELQRRQQQDRLQGHFSRGVRHLEQGRSEQAIEEFKAALELEPDRGATYALLAAATAAADRRDEAIDYYRRALALEPGEAAHHNNLGTLLARRGRLEEALSHFEKAAQLDPDRAATYRFNIGAALLNAGRPGDAIPALRQALRSDPTLAVGHYFLGLALVRTSPRSAAESGSEHIEPRPGTIEAFQRYLQLEPDGEYAEPARGYLKQLGVLPLERLLPGVPPGAE